MVTRDEEVLVAMLLAADVRGNTAHGVRMLKDHELRLEAEARVPETRSMPRFVACDGWMHPFADGAAEVEVRWVFDRRSWRLTSSYVRVADDRGWRPSDDDEARDLEESLVLANGELLVDASDWDDCFDCERPPAWATDEANRERASPASPATPGDPESPA